MFDATSFMPQLDIIRRPLPHIRCKPENVPGQPKAILAKTEKSQPDRRQKHR
jgi:hypothetical protein